MRLTAILLGLVAFLAIVVANLAALGPSGALSIIYILFAALFATALVNIVRGKTYPTGKPPSKVPTKKWLFVASLLNVLGGLSAFVVYWVTKDHLVAATALMVCASLSLLSVILAGGKIESP